MALMQPKFDNATIRCNCHTGIRVKWGTVRTVVFSPDDAWLAVGGAGNSADIHVLKRSRRCDKYGCRRSYRGNNKDGRCSLCGFDTIDPKGFSNPYRRYMISKNENLAEEVYAISFAPDPRAIFDVSDKAPSCRLAVGGDDKKVTCFDLHKWNPDKIGGVDTQSVVWECLRTGEVRACTFSPDSARVAAGGVDNRVGIIDAATGVLLNHISFPCLVTELIFSLDSMRLFVGGINKKVSAMDLQSRSCCTSVTHACL